jgi:N-acetylmuramoyl-L-alanine amidase
VNICIDPGHTGISDPGAVGHGGTKEADINLIVSFMLRDCLRNKGHQVLMTRTAPDDSVDSLKKRVGMAESWGADLMVSIHCNSFSDHKAHGFEVWTCVADDESIDLAKLICEEVEKLFPCLAIRGTKEKNFTVLTGNHPAVLCELAFVSNPVEEGMLNNSACQLRWAEAICNAIQIWKE